VTSPRLRLDCNRGILFACRPGEVYSRIALTPPCLIGAWRKLTSHETDTQLTIKRRQSINADRIFASPVISEAPVTF